MDSNSEEGGAAIMQQPFPLSTLPCGQSAVISIVHGTGAMHDRLQELGFTPNALVTCLFPSAFGDPRAYCIRDTVIALRAVDALQVLCLNGGER